jgi:nucleoside permease NupC
MKTLINIVIILALLTQVSHASYVFNVISQNPDELFTKIISWIFAISLETSIFIFTMYSRTKTATMFAFISTLINILYYWYIPDFSLQFIAMLIISPVIPLTIWNYSELIKSINKKVGRPIKN